jgi:Asp-tRNA(Asn)/Glu-tRNA(Gln) amidotransferase B subunit
MPNVNLSLDLASLFVEAGELDGDPKNLRDAMRTAVVEAAAAKLVAGFDHEELYEMRQDVTRLRAEAVRAAIADQVEAAMAQPIQRTTKWGDKLGEVTNVRELIREELEAFLSGTTTTRKIDSSDKSPHNLRELINLVARDTMHGEMGKQVRAARAEVDKRVQAILVQAIAEKLAPVKT